MEYNNIDFNADKVKQYEAVREAMAKIYAVDNPTFFRPPRITELSQEDSQNEQFRQEILQKQKQDKDLIRFDSGKTERNTSKFCKCYDNWLTKWQW